MEVGESFPIHGFGINDESLYAAYLIFGNTTWLERVKQDYYFNVENVTSNSGQGHMINNGLIAHLPPDTNLGSSLGDEAEDSWGIYARRFGAIMYSISGNQSYLHSANMLFLNYSNAGKQTYGIQGHVNCTDYTDYDVQEKEHRSHYIIYRNISITKIDSFDAYAAVFGLPQIGVIPTSSAPVLVASANNAVVFDTINVQFEYYVPVQTVILNASLWTNATGTWAGSSWNSTPATSISLNSICYNFGDCSDLKTYLWTIQLCTDSGSVFAAPNYIVNVYFPIWTLTGGTTRTISLL